MPRLSSVLLAAALFAAPAAAQNRPAPAPAAPATRDSTTPSPFKKFTDLVRGAELRAGFFDTYEKAENLYLVIPRDRLGQDFLMEFKIAQGIGTSGLFGGTMLSVFEGNVVSLERHGDRIFLLQRPHRFTAREGGAAAKAVGLTFGSSVLESAKIESIRDDSAVAINAYDWFVSDLSGIGHAIRFLASTTPGRPGQAQFDKPRSYVESVRGFPQNLNVRARLTFRPGEPVELASVPDGRYLSLTVHYTFAALPDTPMTPRLGDDRVGYFVTALKDFSEEDRTFFLRYVNRWRLEPGERAGQLWRPKKPIVYYIDPTVPEEYRPYFKAGVEAWNQAFEAAGWQDAIRAEPLPEGAEAEDLRYPTLRWNTSDQPGYGAIGPSVTDPRTGEILDADILFEANMVLGWKSFWRANIEPARALEEMFQASPLDAAAVAAGGELASLADELSAQGTLLRTALIARGELRPGDPVPTEYIGQAMKRVVMHEVGHTLGLRHNFRSSYDTPFDKLHDRAWTEMNGLGSSVMEYPGINLAPRGQPNGYYYSPSVGSYDRWAITYGYAPDSARAAAVARETAQPGFAYGTDEDARGPGALDPSVNVYDLSADPLAWGKQRAELIRGIWATLPDQVLTDNAPYSEVTDAFRTLLTQYSRALAPAVKYVGGQFQYRDHVGDPSGRAPFVNVPRARQLEALTFVTEYGLGEGAFPVPAAVLAKFGADRWSHWGNTNTVAGRIDYPLHEQVAGVQRALLTQLTQPFLFARIRDAEQKFGSGNVLTIPEMMDRLTQAIWSEVWAPPGRNVTAMRRDLQRAYIDQLTQIVATPPDRMPADARAVARQKLVDLNRRIGTRLAPPAAYDAYTTAHLQEVRARIGKALEAGLEVERR